MSNADPHGISAHEPARVGLLRRTADLLRAHGGFLVVLAFAALFLSPLLRSPFISDDIFCSSVGGYLRLRGISFTQQVYNDVTGWMIGNGRFFPLSLLQTFAVYYLFSNLLAYKILTLSLVLMDVALLYCLLCRWNIPRVAAQLACLSLVLLLQFRGYHDPILSFAGLLEVVTAELLLAMIALREYLRSGRRGWLAVSVGCYACSILTYEISYLFIAMYLALAHGHFRNWRSALLAMRPYAYVATLAVVFTLGLRFHLPKTPGHAYQPNLSLHDVARTSARQAISALPVSYATLSPHRALNFDGRRLLTRWDNWLICAAAGGLTLALLRSFSRRVPSSNEPPFGLLVAGLLVWILPGLPIALSPKYQEEVKTGIGYLPVYVQYFGIALLAAWGILWLSARFAGQWPKFALGLVIVNACVAMITFDTNRTVVNNQREQLQIAARINLEAALRAGVCDEVAPDSTLLVNTWHQWLQAGWADPAYAFFAQHLHRKVNAVNAKAPTLGEKLASLPRPSAAICDGTQGDDSGYVILSSLESRPAPPGDNRFFARKFRIFVRGEFLTALEQQQPGQVVASSIHSGTADEAVANQCVDWSALKLLKRGRGWAIYESGFAEPADVAAIRMCATNSSEISPSRTLR